MREKVIIIGAGGHARVICDVVRSVGDFVVGFLDDNLYGNEINGIRVLGKVNEIKKYRKFKAIIGIGNTQIRERISRQFPDLSYYTAIDSSAIVSKYAHIGEGSVVMPNAVVNANARVGKHCIVNTGVIVEHDCVIDDYAHLSPHATVCGTAHIGKNSHVGAGATIINNVSICDNVIIGAGASVIDDIKVSGTYVGVPAKHV